MSAKFFVMTWTNSITGDKRRFLVDTIDRVEAEKVSFRLLENERFQYGQVICQELDPTVPK